jgi:hypothetical protein
MSSFFDSASLVQIPSGYSDGTLYSVKPIDGSGDLTFSRGSDIEATRVASNGYIQKAKVNLLLQSNSFDTTWTNFQSTETGGQSGYDGTNDAWKLTRLVDGANGFLYQTGLSFSLATFSVYAKAAEENWIYIEIVGSTFPAQYFDLQNGVKGTASGIGFIDSSIEAVSGATGWYRISITANVSSGSRVSIYNATADNTLTGSVNNGVYIQDAQLNYGLVAQEYVETTTTSVVSGITNDMPRLDYSGGASCPSLLLEPSRTNAIPQSEYIQSWGGANTTLVTNAATSPEGVQNATSVTFASGGYWYKSVSLSYTTGQAFTWSIYTTTEDIITRWGASTPAGTDTTSIVNVGNGWFRQTITRVVSGSGTANFQPLMDAVFVGVGTTFYVYGAMLEPSAPYVSSYIPTYGTSATRTADSCSKTGISSLIGQSEGTLFTEFVHNGADILTTQSVISVNSGNTTNFVNIGVYDGRLNPAARGSGTNIFDLFVGPNPLPAGTHKIALAYKSNDFAIYLNGSSVYTSTSAATFSLSQLDLGTFLNLNTQLGDGIKQALLFKTRLSNADLATLTA